MSALGRIAAVARIETLRLMRSRIAFTMLLFVPMMQVLLFGTAIRPNAATVSVAIAAESPASTKTVADAIGKQAGLTIVDAALKPGQAEAAVHEGRALIGIEVPAARSFANPLQVQKPLRIIVDAANAGLTTAAVARIETAYWRALAERAGAQDSGTGLNIERLYNPDARADWTFLPSLVGVTVMIAMIMLGSLSLAREREAGTWEALLALPVRPAELLTGKLLPYAIIGTVQGALVLATGLLFFDLPAHGSILALLALLPLFAAAHLALGYAISARAATQLETLQGAVAFYLPAMLLSGFLYPFETLPEWAQWIGSVFPLTHFIHAAQDATLRGGAAADILAHGWPILGFLAAFVLVALATQSRRLD